LIEACRLILSDHHVGSFGLAEVAAAADVPKTSVYFFFPRIEDLLATLAVEVAQDLLAWLNRPISGPFTAWSQIVAAMVERGRSFYEQSRAALEIQLGPYTPSDIKNRDRTNDMSIAILLKDLISDHFVVPDLHDIDGAFFRAIEIADLMFMLSVREHGTLTDFYVAEATRAANAYLELYLPRLLPVRA
jgi:AcrR family transcriptional regulator